MRYVALLMVFGLFACSSAQKVEKVDTNLDVKGTVATEQIGVDDKGQAIVQEETGADDMLKKQRWANAELENSLRHEYEQLQRCRNDLADPRLGGNGEVSDLPEVDSAMDLSKVKEEFGLTEQGKLSIVKKELFTDRLKRERAFEASVKSSIKIVKKHRADCERKMGYSRVKAGLKATRYTRDEKLGHEYESDLDAAFRNAERDKARSTAAKQ